MGMIEQNYRIEGFLILLNEDCILSRFTPLVQMKNTIVEALKAMGCATKHDCKALTDDALYHIGIADKHMMLLFRNFLSLYDINEKKLNDIKKYTASFEEKKSLLDLARLPGVQLTRALLYYYSGYVCLQDIAATTSTAILDATKDTIRKRQLQSVPLLPKEARTHIAVAKVLTDYAAS